MDDRETRERAGAVMLAFEREFCRAPEGGMRDLLSRYAGIARCVNCGEYHRGLIFREMVAALGGLGVDVEDVPTDPEPPSRDIHGAAVNARSDTLTIYGVVRGDPLLKNVADTADDLMACLRYMDFDLDLRSERLHDAVAGYLAAHTVTGICDEYRRMSGERPRTEGVNIERTIVVRAAPAVREAPERVIFNPPATIAFWPDGTKTVARCAEGEAFSEYTGLLVCIAKRHLEVPRRAMFEDVMAKLLKRAERQAPRAGKTGEAA